MLVSLLRQVSVFWPSFLVVALVLVWSSRSFQLALLNQSNFLFMGGLRFAFFDPTEAMKMSLLGKRISVYFLCFSILMLPYHKANAIGWGAAAVVLDVITVAWPDGDDIKTGGICGGRKFAVNDPIWKCEGRTSKSNWLGKAKTSSKWGSLLLAAGFLLGDSVQKTNSGASWVECNNVSGVSFDDCYAKVYQSISEGFYDYFQGEPNVQLRTTPQTSSSPYTVYFDVIDSANPSTKPTAAVYKAYFPDYTNLTDDEFIEDFWQTSPVIPPETWLPDPTPEIPNPVHPDPEWFPETIPVSPPYVPAPDTTPTYPQPLPDTHPDHRPDGEPAPVPQPGDFPSVDPVQNPDYWPDDYPSPGEWPEEWPLPGYDPVFDPVTNPDPDTGTGTDPDTGTNPDTGVIVLPNPLPVVGPMTLSEFQTNQSSQWQNAANALNLPTFDTPQQQITDAMTDFIDNKVNQEVPGFDFNPFGYFSFGGGSCIPIEVNPTIGGKSMGSIQLKEHCQPMEEYVRPTLEWALYLMTGLYIYMSFTRTVRSV